MYNFYPVISNGRNTDFLAGRDIVTAYTLKMEAGTNSSEGDQWVFNPLTAVSALST